MLEETKYQPVVKANKKLISKENAATLLAILKTRFEKNMHRHEGIEWTNLQTKLEANTKKLWSLDEMERTGGEPDVVEYNKKTSEYIFYDCSLETPAGRRSICYDNEGQESRKEHKPVTNAIDMANEMGIKNESTMNNKGVTTTVVANTNAALGTIATAEKSSEVDAEKI